MTERSPPGDGDAETVEEGGRPRVARPAPEALARGAPLGRYVVLGTLGAGGMGVVYDAFDPDLNRRVAIKQLLTPRNDHGQQTRLMREAQALARISHPNVVNVFDVGLHEGAVFIALERVEGETLRAWLKPEARAWREVVRRFIDAGRGLAAAHAARLVHRDFKPHNVLVGTDGRARVMDFGIAREDGDDAVRAPVALPDTDSIEVWSESLTEEGSIIGTLAYMSPEQLKGAPATPLSDQFSFCVALYEGLFRQHPFGEKTKSGRSRALAAMDGRASPPPPTPRLSRALKAAVMRGLEREPSHRHASMEALLEVLERSLRVDWRGWAFAGVVALLAATVGGNLAWQSLRRSECGTGNEFLRGVWDEAARKDVDSALLATRRASGSTVSQRVQAALDVYTRQWATQRDEACTATRVRGEFSEEVLALRLACLDRRLGEVRALVSELRAADEKVLEEAVDAALGLEELDSCADAAALRSRVPLPSDSASRAEIDAVFARLAQARALEETGRASEARQLVETMASEGAANRWPLIRAELDEALATSRRRQGDLEGAREALEQAVFHSELAGADGLTARASIRLAFLLGSQLGRVSEAESWQRHARALLTRSQGEAAANERLAASTGSLLVARGRFEEARPWLEQALERQVSRHGERSSATATAHNNLGALLARIGRHEDAFVHYQAALATWRELRGETHASVATGMHNLALLYAYLGRYAAADKEIRGALEIQTAALGPAHRKVATSTQVLAMTLVAQGKCAAAEPLQREALKVLAAEQGGHHPRSLAAQAGLLWCLQGEARKKQGVASAKAVVTSLRAAPRTEAAPRAMALTAAASAFLDAGKLEDAVPLAEEAVRVLEENPSDVMGLARARLMLARALRSLKRDPERVLTLARNASDAVAAPAVEDEQLRGAVASFLAERR